jgi:hypothetical protein
MERENETNARTEHRTVAVRERRVGECRQRLTFTKQRRVGLACHPVMA